MPKYIIGFSKAQARKIEKIFRKYGNPYFTDGTGNYSTFDKWGRVHNGKVYVLLSDLRDLITNGKEVIDGKNLRQALRTEFSNTDIPDWIRANRELYSILK